MIGCADARQPDFACVLPDPDSPTNSVTCPSRHPPSRIPFNLPDEMSNKSDDRLLVWTSRIEPSFEWHAVYMSVLPGGPKLVMGAAPQHLTQAYAMA